MATSTENLLDTARRHGLRLTSEARLDTSGADFLVAHAFDEHGKAWVLRAPRRAEVWARAENERRALRLVQAHLSIAVPDWQIFSPELIAYPRLAGEPAAVIDLEAGGYVWRFDERAPPEPFLGSLAQALAALHTLPTAAATTTGLSVDAAVSVRNGWARRMEGARTMIDVPEALWTRWQAWLAEDRFWPTEMAVIHGDLHPPHILLDDQHRVVGFLDWTEARVSDPATDFTLLFATLGRDTIARMLDLYRTAGAPVWPHMLDHIQESWSAYPAVLADFARTSGEPGPRELAQTLVSAAIPSPRHRAEP
jgi:macrolide phosphotransferase